MNAILFLGILPLGVNKLTADLNLRINSPPTIFSAGNVLLMMFSDLLCSIRFSSSNVFYSILKSSSGSSPAMRCFSYSFLISASSSSSLSKSCVCVPSSSGYMNWPKTASNSIKLIWSSLFWSKMENRFLINDSFRGIPIFLNPSASSPLDTAPEWSSSNSCITYCKL